MIINKKGNERARKRTNEYNREKRERERQRERDRERERFIRNHDESARDSTPSVS